MTDQEILLDLLLRLTEDVHWTLDGMSLEALRWQPDGEANNIAVTVWHFSRAFDVFKTRLFENGPPEAELWYACGWAVKTGYHPRGIGWGGFGNLAGYTRAEVDAVPILSADELLAYFDQVYEALHSYLGHLSSEALYQPAVGWPDEPQTVYEWLKNLLVDSQEHLGEIKAIKALWDRRITESPCKPL